LQLLPRRVIVTLLLAWVPLLALSIAEGHAWGDNVSLTFLEDLETQARLLLALPILIFLEPLIYQRMRPVVSQFLVRNLIPDDERWKFDAAINSAARLRNSVSAEILLIVLVYVVGIGYFWRALEVLPVASWYSPSATGKFSPSLAGWWMGCVSLPMFQFLLLRWYYRLFIWARFLWQVSRIQLNFMPLHPDRCGGMGFLSSTSNAFAPLLFAQGLVLAGMMASRIFYAGAKLPQFEIELVALGVVLMFTILGPLLVFSSKLAVAKRTASREFGVLAVSYVRAFDRKWLRGVAPADEPFLGSSDIQSLADLGNSFAVVKEMNLVPFSTRTVLQLAAAILAPVAPLLLTMLPVEDLLARLLQIVF
jgi:hypothetical protein